jgi:hypothetical protein
MKKTCDRSTGAPARCVWAWSAACALLLLSGGCATGPQDVLVRLPAYLSSPERHAESTAVRAMVRIDPVQDARRDAVGGMVGERTTFGRSMGRIELDPVPTAAIGKVLHGELANMGFRAVDSGEQSKITAQLAKFEITTPGTAFYWDITGAIELDLAATGQGAARHETRYVAQCTTRTYVWPSEELILGVVSACLRDIGGKIRGDATLLGVLSAR